MSPSTPRSPCHTIISGASGCAGYAAAICRANRSTQRSASGSWPSTSAPTASWGRRGRRPRTEPPQLSRAAADLHRRRPRRNPARRDDLPREPQRRQLPLPPKARRPRLVASQQRAPVRLPHHPLRHGGQQIDRAGLLGIQAGEEIHGLARGHLDDAWTARVGPIGRCGRAPLQQRGVNRPGAGTRARSPGARRRTPALAPNTLKPPLAQTAPRTCAGSTQGSQAKTGCSCTGSQSALRRRRSQARGTPDSRPGSAEG